jgi:spore photoproduct lyase
LLSTSLKTFLEQQLKNYNFTFQETKKLFDIANDLHQWEEGSIQDFWIETKDFSKESKKKLLKVIVDSYEDIKQKTKSYDSVDFKRKTKKISLNYDTKDSLGLGRCPVESEKTRCCNLLTLDAVESCGFDCSYCSIQSFYKQDKVYFDTDFASKLQNLKLDKNKSYHIGTGQSSDSLMWGNKAGILDALFDFAKENSNVILEMKTKSNNIKYFLENEVPKNIICTWSLNTQTIIDNEEHLSASLDDRINCAKQLEQKGVKVGFHFHPMVHYDKYKEEYGEIFKTLINTFDPNNVALVSLGTLTFIKPVMKKIKARDFKTKILQMPLVEVAGKYSYDENTKIKMFRFAYENLNPWHKKVFFYMCMEPHHLWDKVFGYSYSSNDEFEREMIKAYAKKLSNTQ